MTISTANEANTRSKALPLKKMLTDHVATALALFTGFLFFSGFLIENIHLSLQGFDAPVSVQARSLLVGAAYYVYLLIPMAIIGLPLYYVRALTHDVVAFQSSSRAFRVTIGIGIGGVLCVATSIGLHYFFCDTYWSALGFPMVRGLANYYLHPWSWIQWCFIYVPCTIVLARRYGSSAPLNQTRVVNKLLVPWIIGGIMCSLMGYIMFVYPNLERAVGGGQPAIVAISVPRSQLSGIDPMGMLRAEAILEPLPTDHVLLGPLLLWADADGILYLSPMATLRLTALSLSIPRENIVAIRYLGGAVKISHGLPDARFNELGVRSKVPGFDAMIPLERLLEEMRDELRNQAKAASRPDANLTTRPDESK